MQNEPEQDFYRASPTADGAPVAQAQHNVSISWTASEFIAHTKTAAWYAVVIVVCLVASVLVFLFSDKFIAILMLIVGILFCMVAARKPRELPYAIDSKGITVDKKLYKFSDFKSFAIVQEEGIESIWFIPLQRFSPGLSIYFSPQDGDKIVEALSNFLPLEQRELDIFDTLMHKIRF